MWVLTTTKASARRGSNSEGGKRSRNAAGHGNLKIVESGKRYAERLEKKFRQLDVNSNRKRSEQAVKQVRYGTPNALDRVSRGERGEKGFPGKLSKSKTEGVRDRERAEPSGQCNEKHTSLTEGGR